MAPEPAYTLDSGGHLPKGLDCGDKAGLVDVLHWWLQHSTASTVGPIERGKFKGRPWLYATLGGEPIRVNADTTRPAVSWVVRQMHKRPDTAWRVVRNRRGRINKVIVGSHTSLLAELIALIVSGGDPRRGWYVYTQNPLGEERHL